MFKAIISVANAKTGNLWYSQSPRVFESESELEQYKKRFAYGTIEVTHEVVGEATVEELFTQLVNEHDLTFNYSDAHTVWKRGCAELSRIKGLIPTVDAWSRPCQPIFGRWGIIFQPLIGRIPQIKSRMGVNVQL